MTHQALNIGMRLQAGYQSVFVGIGFVMQLAYRGEQAVVFYQQQGFIAHVQLLVEHKNGQVVIVVIFEFVVFGQPVVLAESLQQWYKIVTGRHIQFSYVTASQAKVEIYIICQQLQFFGCFAAVQYGSRACGCAG